MKSTSADQAASLQTDITALQQRLASAEAELAAAQARLQQLEQLLQAQQAEAAASDKRMAAQMEQLKMDVGFEHISDLSQWSSGTCCVPVLHSRLCNIGCPSNFISHHAQKVL